jgi:hypothetical protein
MMSGFDKWLKDGGGKNEKKSGSNQIAKDLLRVSYGNMAKDEFKKKHGKHTW